MPRTTSAAGLVFLLAGANAGAAEFAATVPIYDTGTVTYYVAGSIDGYGETEFMVDTGSAYMAINEKTLRVLKREGRADYVKKLSGILADGSRMTVPVYRLSAISIGERCTLRNVEAAVFRGSTRHILGLSALKKAGPFQVSFNPPRLSLGDCYTQTAATAN